MSHRSQGMALFIKDSLRSCSDFHMKVYFHILQAEEAAFKETGVQRKVYNGPFLFLAL